MHTQDLPFDLADKDREVTAPISRTREVWGNEIKQSILLYLPIDPATADASGSILFSFLESSKNSPQPRLTRRKRSTSLITNRKSFCKLLICIIFLERQELSGLCSARHIKRNRYCKSILYVYGSAENEFYLCPPLRSKELSSISIPPVRFQSLKREMKCMFPGLEHESSIRAAEEVIRSGWDSSRSSINQ